MVKPRPKSIIIVSIVILVFGLMMFGYWTKYILDGMPLQGVPIIPEAIGMVLAFITAIGLFQMRTWSLASGLFLSGIWFYGCVTGINLVLYDLFVHQRLNIKSPVGAWIDAILFVVITAWAVFFAIYLWRMRKILLRDKERV